MHDKDGRKHRAAEGRKEKEGGKGKGKVSQGKPRQVQLKEVDFSGFGGLPGGGWSFFLEAVILGAAVTHLAVLKCVAF